MQAESNTNPHDALRARVRAVLAREGMTQRELARRIGYARPTLSIWLAGAFVGDDSRIAERLAIELLEIDRTLEDRRTPMAPGHVRAHLEQRGVTLASLARAHGISASSLSAALRRPHPRHEAIIADALGVEPALIWPDRYARRAA